MSDSKIKIPFLDLRQQYRSLQAELQAVIIEVLESAQYVGGKWVEQFEQEFAAYVGAEQVIALSSGTAALELSLKAVGIGSGDEVIVPGNSFFATAEAVSNVGATPVFVDVDLMTGHLDPLAAERAITARTRAVIPVHLYGWAVDLQPFEKLTEKHSLWLIEDAAQAHGVGRAGKRVGSSGRLTCFSFYPGKNLGALGDAGAVSVNDPVLADRIRQLRDHGSPAKYRHAIIGTNARMASIQAAALSVKLAYLDQWNQQRYENAKLYLESLREFGVGLPVLPPQTEHNFHLFVIRLQRRDDLRTHLLQEGIESGIHYPVPLHLTDAYQALGAPKAGSLPVTEKLANEILSLPMFPELTPGQIELVARSIAQFTRTNDLAAVAN
jgi:dTDP-4-amino-4,6-dideoxygalactose transaminase